MAAVLRSIWAGVRWIFSGIWAVLVFSYAASLVLGFVWVIAFWVTAAIVDDSVYWDDVRTGDCLTTLYSRPFWIAEEEILDEDKVRVVPCVESHEQEVFGVLDFDRARQYPDTDRLDDVFTGACSEMFSAYIGVGVDVAGLTIAPNYPTPAEWERGERRIVCSAIEADDDGVANSVTGSARRPKR
jgi:hypothetical protein